MRGPELKNCPDGCHTDFITMQQIGMQHFMRCDCGWSSPIRANKARALAAWNTRTPDPAQIRADAIREAVARFPDGRQPWPPKRIREALLAIIDTPLSPTAVDGIIAPDAGGKEGV